MKADIATLAGETSGSVDLDESIFGLEPRADLLQRMVEYQRAKRRQGTHKTKTRGEIARTKKKIVRQKGSGGARHGPSSVGLFRGGGKAFGRLPRDYAHDLNKKVRTLALKHALSSKQKAGALVILDEARIEEPRTRVLREAFSKLELSDALIIGGVELDNNFQLAARNLPKIEVLPTQGINVYDVLRREKLVLTKDALASLQERLGAKEAA